MRPTSPYLHLVWRMLAALAGLLHLCLAAALIFAISYLMGNSIWTAAPKGNDAALHISYAAWIDQYWPHIPHWYPVQGGGISILHGYPLLAHVVVVIVHRASGMSLTQAYGLVGFLTVPLTALGIYLFSWGVYKRQTIGLVAAIFYLAVPITWTWIHDWGFLARNVAVVFLPTGALCFDKYFETVLKSQAGRSRRLWFLALILSIFLTTLSHPIIGGAALFGWILLYCVFLGITADRGKRRHVWTCALRAMAASGIVSGFVLAFWAVPFYIYSTVANREGLNVLARNDVPVFHFDSFLGLSSVDPRYIYHNVSFTVLVVTLAVVGTLLALVHSRKALAMGLSSFLAVLLVLYPDATYAISTFRPPLSLVLSAGSLWSVVGFMLPVLAGFGAWALARTIVFPSTLIRRGSDLPKQGRFNPWYILRDIVGSSLALVIAGLGFYLSNTLPVMKELNRGQGPTGLAIQDLTLASLDPRDWPRPTLIAEDPLPARSQALRDLLPARDLLRIDVSPYQGQLAQDLSAFSGASQLNTYSFQLSLIHSMWGYQQGVFYSNVYGTPKALNDLAKWFGVEYVFLNPDWDPIEKYREAEWEPVLQGAGMEVWRFPSVPGYATLSSRPTILVISSEKKRPYETVFRIANEGAIPYDQAWLVQGRESVDSYSLAELKRFDALFLHGYTYRSSKRAWALLDEYVRGGGALFVDTGWQWTVPEWEFGEAPAVLPVAKLAWTNYGITKDYKIENREIAGDVQEGGFGLLDYQGEAWGVSGANRDDVRGWARVVLSVADHPLIVAGEYGEGRVVWSGMNLVSHAYDKENESEILLLNHLVSWLTRPAAASDQPLVVSREGPDHIEFFLELPEDLKAAIYWREAFYPNWHAYLVSGDGNRSALPVYPAGPGFMLMPFTAPAGQARIDLVYELSVVERVATWVSPVAFIALILYGFGVLSLRRLPWKSLPDKGEET